MAFAIFCILNGIVWIAIVYSLSFWVRRLWLRYTGNEVNALIPLENQSQPLWSVAEFFVMLGLTFVVIVGLHSYMVEADLVSVASDNTQAAPEIATSSMLAMLSAQMLANLLAMGGTIAWMMFLYGAKRNQIGFTRADNDVRLGLKASLWFIPPVLVISLFVSWLIPYSHPALDVLSSETSLGSWFLLFVGTAVVAPLTEEFMFRAMLQGGLQRIADANSSGGGMDPIESDTAEVGGDAARYSANPYVAPIPAEDSLAADHQVIDNESWRPAKWWPIFVASAVFAIMHLGQGAAPVPLFVLSLGLGYLYRQTGSIIAPLIVHVVLNSMTLFVEFSRVSAGM